MDKLQSLSTEAIQSWLDRHRAGIEAGVNVGQIDRTKAQRMRAELARRRLVAAHHRSEEQAQADAIAARNEDNAYQRGKAAHAAGTGPYPLTDSIIAAAAQGAMPGDITALMAAWSKGWHDANIEKEV